MKKLLLSSILAVSAFSFSSCCFTCLLSKKANYIETKERACGYDTVTKEVAVATKDEKGGMLTQTVTEKTPRYKTVKHRVKEQCVRSWCPNNGPCGSTGENVINMATDQGGTGSPHIGQVITMKTLAP